MPDSLPPAGPTPVKITSGKSTDAALGTALNPLHTTGGGGGGTFDQGAPNALANAWPVEVTDGTNVLGTGSHPVRSDPTGTTTQPVSAASLPLPSGAATSAAQTTGNTSVASIDGKTPALVGGRVPVDGSGVTQPVSGTFFQATQPVSVASLPLPSGAATETTVAAASAKLPATIGQKAMSQSLSVAVASDQSGIPVTGSFFQATQPISAATLPLPSGAATLSAQGTGNASVASIDTKTPALVSGRVPVDGSGVTQPVSGSFFPATQPVSAVALPLPAGAATSALQTPPSSLTFGQATIATPSTAKQLTASTTTMQNGAVAQALAGNVGLVYVGFSNVTGLGGAHPGYELQAGQAMPLGLTDLSTVYVIGVNVGDGVCFVGS